MWYTANHGHLAATVEREPRALMYVNTRSHGQQELSQEMKQLVAARSMMVDWNRTFQEVG